MVLLVVTTVPIKIKELEVKEIVSYNVNGIRAALRKGFAQWLEETGPDVVCV